MRLGRAHPRELAEELTLQEFVEWQAYYAAEPWGEERADYRAALQAYVTHLAARGIQGTLVGRQVPSTARLEDFLVLRPATAPQRRTSDPAKMERVFEQLYASMQEHKRASS